MRYAAAYAATAILALAPRLLVEAQAPPERAGFTVPAAPWILILPTRALTVTRQQVKPDGRSGYFMLSGKDGGLNVSFFIEPETKCHSSRECRDMVWKDLKPTLKGPIDVTSSEIGETSVVEYFLPSFQGIPVQQHHLYAEFVKSGFWVDLHVTKVAYKPEDRALFLDLLNAIVFSEKAQTAVTPGGA